MSIITELNKSVLAMRRARKSYNRQRQLARDEQAGRELKLTLAEQAQRAAVALFTHDAWLAIWELLERDGANLELTWAGKCGQLVAVYADSRPPAVLMVATWTRQGRVLAMPGMRTTEIGQRICTLLDQYQCEFNVFWFRDWLILGLGAREVPESAAALTLIRVKKGETGRTVKPQADVQEPQS